ncbi:MAG: AAA family ATPase [Clostridiaceae bacterium]|nr:AAA family ATPase [Clostridiaceae bacterium]
MKIKLLDIKGFGKFNKLRIEPKEGFNIIFEANELGKSTLQTFIRAMLYGQKGGRRLKDGSLPPLKHNKPWNSDQYAGILEYTLDNGKSYRVGRNFDKGTTNIYDDGANNLTGTFPIDKEKGPMFAEEHLGIDEAAFERTAFIGQLRCVIDDEGKKNLINKLSNLNSTGSEDISLTEALKALDSTLLEKVGTKTSTTRPLNKINNILAELEQKKTEIEQKNNSFMETVLELRRQNSILDELNLQLDGLYIKKESMKTSKLLSLRKELEDLISQRNIIEKSLEESERNIDKLKNYENISIEEVSEISMMLREEKQVEEMLQLEQTRLAEFREKCDELSDTLEPEELFEKKVGEVQEAIKAYNEFKEQEREKTLKHNLPVKHKRSWMPFIIPAGLLSSILLLLKYYHSQNPLILGASIGIAVVTVIILFINNIRQNNAKTIVYSAAEELNRILQKAGFADMTDYVRYREDQVKKRELYNNYKKQYSDTKERIESLIAKKERFASNWDSFIADCKVNCDNNDKAAFLETIKFGVANYIKASEDKKRFLSEIGNLNEKCGIVLREAGVLAGKDFLSADDFINYVKDLNPETRPEGDNGITLARIDDIIRETESRKKETEIKIAAIKARLEQAPKESELAKVLEEISYYTEKKEELEIKGASLVLASQVLKEAALKMQRDYIPYLNQEMSRMMNILSGGRYNKISTNDELSINLESPETDELIPVNRLSAGTIDQVYFCMRLAAVTLIEKGRERLPLFLDEPFSQYDEERVRNAFELLREMSEKRQIFFFTCREREYEIAASVFGEKMNRIRLG